MRLSLYADGERILYRAQNMETTISASASELTLGNQFQGVLDEVRIFDYALHEDEVEHFARGGSGQLVPGEDLRGDFNDDGSVGFGDFLLFAAAFGSKNSTFDLDDNGIVGFGDFVIFAVEFGNRKISQKLSAHIG